ncbi:DNA mismatch repair protein Msh2 [Cryptotermes secundus]|uniref:DNA mismatch repair protein MSH2 n=1 Tax=Cryptotermes secundus TaxID=105785 RepID=A0A2J7QQ67_9NEOP|nr:DNA mismatch repair protein Msh2 [Cryptotermes secundus]
MAVQPNQHLTVDAPQQKGFVNFFKSLPEKPATTVRFFNRGDYFTLHGADAIFAAKEVFRSAAVVKFIGADNNRIESLALSKSNFESFVRDLLLVKQYRVEVYVTQGSGTKNSNDWTLEYKGSPGNLVQFEDLLFSNVDLVVGTAVIAVRLAGNPKARVVGMGFADTTEWKLSVCEFPDDQHFSNLEALTVQLGPKEVLLPITPESSVDMAEVKKVMERSSVLVTQRKKTEFSTDGLAQDLNRLLLFMEGQQHNSLALPELNFTTATSSLAALIKYLELGADQGNFGQFTLTTLDHTRFVRMDAAAIRALSLLPPPGSGAANRNRSVLGLIDQCRTAQGHRLLAQWLKQPLRDRHAIAERHDVVQVILQDTAMRQALRDEHLRRIPDLQALSKKLGRKKAGLQDCYRIYQAVGRVPQLMQSLDGHDDFPALRCMFIEPLTDLLSDMQRFQDMVETTLDMDQVDRGEFLVKPSFDDDLQELRQMMDSLEERIKKQLTCAARDLGLEPNKTIKLESNAQMGYFLRVTLKEERVLRNNKNYETLDTNKSGVRFHSPVLADLNSEYLRARSRYAEQQKAIVTEIVNIAAGYAGTLQQIGDVLACLDVLANFAEVAVTAPKPFVRPTLHDEGAGMLILKQVRHPCLEVQDGTSFIANDVYFKHGECTFQIITGPNMGGKSTYIRSVGIMALLAQIGSFVPCDEAEMSLVDAILARVGADDCQIKGMSTFMTEMVETAAIIRTATSNSLVIIDELGRGTSTYEGCGIAWAIAEHLAKEVKAFCLFATHFHELTQLAEEVATLRNLHVTAVTSEDSLTLLYQVMPGACDQSFGIHVAEMARFPKHVIEVSLLSQFTAMKFHNVTLT